MCGCTATAWRSGSARKLGVAPLSVRILEPDANSHGNFKGDKLSTVENAVAVREEVRALTAAEHRAQVNLIQQVMREVMEENVHYGKVPGTGKPSLWKPGAEKLSMTFHIAIDPQIEGDL